VAVTQGPSDPNAAAATDSSSYQHATCSKECDTLNTNPSSKGLLVLEKLVAAGSNGSSTAGDTTSSSSSSVSEYYSCPVCRQPQVLNIDNLQVDPNLSQFVDGLRLSMKANSSTNGSSNGSVASELAAPSVASSTSTDTDAAALSRCSSVASELARAAAGVELAVQVEAEDWSQYLLPRQVGDC
jgi:hypothetical protein